MAVNKNPYSEWEKLRSNSDYRTTDTQNISLVRQQLSQPEYLRTSNRVNPGPYRRLRANLANSTAQLPHPYGSEDLWGWQEWTEDIMVYEEPEIAENLLEEKSSLDIKGKDFTPYGEVGGASS